MGPDRTFGTLLGCAVGGGGLLGAAAFRFLRAGVPPAGRSAQALTWHGVLLPGPGDLLIHLISYGLLGILLVHGRGKGYWVGRASACDTPAQPPCQTAD